MNTTLLVVLIVAGSLALAGGIVALVLFILFQASAGWRRVVEAHAATQPPDARVFSRQTVKIGAVTYKRCATVGVGGDGLYLAVGRRAALIPWSEIEEVGQATFFWQRVPVLALGRPTLTTIAMPNDLFAAMRERIADR